jgi:hypothetical protein
MALYDPYLREDGIMKVPAMPFASKTGTAVRDDQELPII